MGGPSAFAVELGHLRLWGADAGGRALWDGGLDGGERFDVERMVERAERFFQAVAAAGADKRDDVGSLRRDPGDRGLCDGEAARLRDRAQRLGEGEVRLRVGSLEAGADAAEVSGPAGRPAGVPRSSRAKARHRR